MGWGVIDEFTSLLTAHRSPLTAHRSPLTAQTSHVIPTKVGISFSFIRLAPVTQLASLAFLEGALVSLAAQCFTLTFAAQFHCT